MIPPRDPPVKNFAPKVLPPLPYAQWEPTKTTLHLFAQIVGKVRLASTPRKNHWWNVALYPSARGLSTHLMRFEQTEFEIEFDFIDHRLRVRTAGGDQESFRLADGLSVRKFYRRLFEILAKLNIGVKILGKPYGVPITTPFEEDREHRTYDADAVRRCSEVLHWSAEVLERFASGFAGKQSPAHLFWHSFDLAMGRYNGKRAPEKPPGTHLVEREAYSHEVIAFGFWAGQPDSPNPAYYTYTAPEPAALSAQPLAPQGAIWAPQGAGHLGVLPYDVVRSSDTPEATLLEFLHSGYDAGVKTAGWDAALLEHRVHSDHSTV